MVAGDAVNTDIPPWAYMVAAGALLTLAQRLTANVLETLERRLVKLEAGADSEEKERRARDHEIIRDLTNTTNRVITLESITQNNASRIGKLESHHDRAK